MEQYLLQNPAVFVDLIERHDELVLRQQIANGNANLVNLLREMQDAVHNMGVAVHAIEANFTQLRQVGPAPEQREGGTARTNEAEHVDDEDDEWDFDSDDDVLEILPLGINMVVNSRGMFFSRPDVSGNNE